MTVKSTWSQGDKFSNADANAVAAQINANTAAAASAAAAAAAASTAAATAQATADGKQPADVDLAAIAALASAANKVPYATGSGAWALADLTPAARALLDDVDAAAQRGTLGVGTSYATITALKAATAADGLVRLLGYYAAGDGGGGVFRWDATDTTSADNGGTIITPTSGLSSSGRWKRVYEGWVNVRWFGVNPSRSDNADAFQRAVDWVSQAYPFVGGTLFVPAGWYVFTFSGAASVITIPADNINIEGEGKGSRLMVSGHAYPNQLPYFFKFLKSGRGQGGGVKNLNFYGNSMLKWCIYMSTWRDAQFLNISAFDIHSGILDAEASDTSNYGESILVQHLDTSGSAGATVTQYGVRFRGGTAAGSKTWSDCWIKNCDFILCWDSGVILDGVDRFSVRSIVAANNGAFTDSIDNTSKAGCLHTVKITRSASLDLSGATGHHVIDDVYLESLSGSESRSTNSAVLIEQLNIAQQIQDNQISNVVTNGNCSEVKLTDASGFGRLNNTTFRGNRNPANATLVIIGAGVENTHLHLTPVPGVPWSTAITDAGTNTVIHDDRDKLGFVAAAKNPDVLVTGAITVDGSDLITSAAVIWPDGKPGTLTITSRDANGAVLAYNITYGSPVTRTYTQPTITRNANGAATNVPAIVVT